VDTCHKRIRGVTCHHFRSARARLHAERGKEEGGGEEEEEERGRGGGCEQRCGGGGEVQEGEWVSGGGGGGGHRNPQLHRPLHAPPSKD